MDLSSSRILVSDTDDDDDEQTVRETRSAYWTKETDDVFRSLALPDTCDENDGKIEEMNTDQLRAKLLKLMLQVGRLEGKLSMSKPMMDLARCTGYFGGRCGILEKLALKKEKKTQKKK